MFISYNFKIKLYYTGQLARREFCLGFSGTVFFFFLFFFFTFTESRKISRIGVGL